MKYIKHFENVFDNISDFTNYGTIKMTLAIDFDNNPEEQLDVMLKNNIFYQILTFHGPGGGWPEFRLLGSHANIKQYLRDAGFEEEGEDGIEEYMSDWEPI